MSTVRVAATFACTVLAALSLLHFYWAGGGRSGIGPAVPSHGSVPVFHPGRLGTLAVASALLAMSLTIAARVNWISAPHLFDVARFGTWIIALIFALRTVGDFRYIGLFKSVKGTLFARRDTLLYTPLCILLSLAIAFVSLYGPPKRAS